MMTALAVLVVMALAVAYALRQEGEALDEAAREAQESSALPRRTDDTQQSDPEPEPEPEPEPDRGFEPTPIPEQSPEPDATSTDPASPPDDVTELLPGLLCRHLADQGFDYADAVAYWEHEGKPDRMDASGNGIPCQTVYPEDELTAFWGASLTVGIPEGAPEHEWWGTYDLWPEESIYLDGGGYLDHTLTLVPTAGVGAEILEMFFREQASRVGYQELPINFESFEPWYSEIGLIVHSIASFELEEPGPEGGGTTVSIVIYEPRPSDTIHVYESYGVGTHWWIDLHFAG